MGWLDELLGNEPEDVPATPPPERSVRDLLAGTAAANPVQDAGREWQHSADPFQATQSDSETGQEVRDEDAPLVFGEHDIVLPEQRIEGRRPRAATPGPTPLDRLLDAGGGAVESGVDWLLNPMAGRVERPDVGETSEPWAEEDTSAATDALVGASHASGLEGLLANLGDYGSLGPEETTREGRLKREAFAADKAAQRSPGAFEAGEAVGTIAPLLIPGAQEAEGASLLSRLGGTAGEGAAYMGLTSDAETPGELARDTALGAGGAVAGHGAAMLARAGGRQLGRTLERTVSEPNTVDLARMSSLLGERSAPISGREMQELLRTLGAGGPREGRIARAAQAIRDMGVVGPFSTISDILAAVQARLPAAEARTAGIRQAFTDAGGRVPAEAVPGAYEEAARALEMDPALAEHAPALQEQADAASASAWRHADEAGGVPLDVAEAALEPVRERAGFRSLTDVPSRQEAMREALRSGRAAVDDVVASQLGGDTAREFPAARRQVQSLRLAEAITQPRAARAAMRSPLASAAGAAGAAIAGGAGAGTAAASGLAYRALRAREASMIASGLETVQALVQSRGYQALGQFGPILERAAARGSLPAVHAMLMRSDPDYVAAVEDATPPTHDVSSAVRALSEPEADDGGFIPDEEDGFIADEEIP